MSARLPGRDGGRVVPARGAEGAAARVALRLILERHAPCGGMLAGPGRYVTSPSGGASMRDRSRMLSACLLLAAAALAALASSAAASTYGYHVTISVPDGHQTFSAPTYGEGYSYSGSDESSWSASFDVRITDTKAIDTAILPETVVSPADGTATATGSFTGIAPGMTAFTCSFPGALASGTFAALAYPGSRSAAWAWTMVRRLVRATGLMPRAGCSA